MKMETADDAAGEVESLRRELERLSGRVTALEAALGARPQTSDPAKTPVDDGFSEDLIVVISAAVAAFLGKRPPIRQIRLMGSSPWAQQGRVTIQASHASPDHRR